MGRLVDAEDFNQLERLGYDRGLRAALAAVRGMHAAEHGYGYGNDDNDHTITEVGAWEEGASAAYETIERLLAEQKEKKNE